MSRSGAAETLLGCRKFLLLVLSSFPIVPSCLAADKNLIFCSNCLHLPAKREIRFSFPLFPLRFLAGTRFAEIMTRKIKIQNILMINFTYF